LANASSFSRRVSRGIFTRDSPLASTRRSKTIKVEGVDWLSFWILLAAGEFASTGRQTTASHRAKSQSHRRGQTRTNCFAERGKQPAQGNTLSRACRTSTSIQYDHDPGRLRHLKPSHLGSYCHSRPDGRATAGRASIGLNRLFSGRDMIQFVRRQRTRMPLVSDSVSILEEVQGERQVPTFSDGTRLMVGFRG
jgi:hypothetical protein